MTESNGSTQARIEDFVATHRNDALGDVATRRLHENDRVRIWEMNASVDVTDGSKLYANDSMPRSRSVSSFSRRTRKT